MYDYFYKFGYKSFGPILYSFCLWINEYCLNNNIDTLYFLSRDGKIVKEAYNILFPKKVNDTFYFHASRRAIIVPSLYKISNIHEIFEKIAFNKRIKMENFLKKIGLEDYDLNEKLKFFELDYDYIIDVENYKSDEVFCDFLNDILLLVKRNALIEYKNFCSYCKKNSFNGKVAIIDIGWFGSMQKAIESLSENLDLHGLYVGLVPNGKIYNSDKASGFLFDSKHGIDLYKKFHYFISIFEFMFLAQEGSTKRYIDNELGYELYDYEYQNINESKYASIIQEAALQFIVDNVNNNFKYDIDNCTKNLLRIMLFPKYSESKIFGDLLFLDDEEINIAKPRKFMIYLLNYKKFIYDFKQSAWRIGFLKRLFKIPFPYYRLNEFLRKKFIKDEE